MFTLKMLELLEDGKPFYPFSQLIILLGFFATYFIEDTMQWLIVRENKKNLVDTKNDDIGYRKKIYQQIFKL